MHRFPHLAVSHYTHFIKWDKSYFLITAEASNRLFVVKQVGLFLGKLHHLPVARPVITECAAYLFLLLRPPKRPRDARPAVRWNPDTIVTTNAIVNIQNIILVTIGDPVRISRPHQSWEKRWDGIVVPARAGCPSRCVFWAVLVFPIRR